ncbi:MAG TPA: CRTAC1 family protein [Thermoanaerobaculia bacterium]|jgi:hypothetical protein|nr:CRTAC1 family protein [Thermoanaerobaculia bacterium]
MPRERLGLPSCLVALLLATPVAGAAEAPPSALPSAPAPRLREVAAAWGLVHRHHNGASGQFYMPETMGSGVALLDYDGDGDLDVFFVDSGALPGYVGEPGRSALFRNEGNGRFRDVTEAAGLRVAAFGMGATAGDVDGDGDLDLYVTAFGPDQLFRNQGDGTFVDATAEAGLGNPLWASSAAFADVDGDGDLDLYVADYVDFSFANNPPCGNKERGLRSYCHPEVYRGLPDRFYRNLGGGRFVEATAAAGFLPDEGKGLGVVFGDVDGDGWQDLFVANDMTPGFLFHNLGGGRFEEVGLLTGTALSDLGLPEAGMGVELADLDGNGWPDLFKTHLDLQTNALYLNQGGLLFTDGRYVSRLAEPSMYYVGFGTAAADLDQDGDLDLVVANGHIVHNVEASGNGSTYRQKNQLFVNDGRGVFREEREAGLTGVRAHRGLAAGDLDDDGDVDLVVTGNDDLAEVYEDVTTVVGGWLQVDLAGAGDNSAGIGARLELAAGGRRMVREVRTGSSYESQNALTAHFGTGGAAPEELAVRWPSGRRQLVRQPPADRRLRLYESAAGPAPRPAGKGFQASGAGGTAGAGPLPAGSCVRLTPPRPACYSRSPSAAGTGP